MSSHSLASVPELIARPCRARNMLAGRVAIDPSSRRELLLLSDMNETTGMELLVIDIAGNTGRSFPAPAGSGSWAFHLTSDDRLVIGTYYDGKFLVFDLKTMEFVHIADFPGETYIWNLAPGNDGRLYGGSYGNGRLGALNLESYEVEDCGAPAPPNLYLRYVSSLPDGRILCAFSTEKPTVLVYDPSTGEFLPAPVHCAGIVKGVSWNGYFLSETRAFVGSTLKEVTMPFPMPEANAGAWTVLTDVSRGQFVFLQQGDAIYRYGIGEAGLTRMADFPLRGGRLLDSDDRGNLYGIRGQEYFVIRDGDTAMHLSAVPIESKPRPMLFLKADDAGRIWGGPHFGQTLCCYDSRSQTTTNTPTVCDEGGEVYDVAFDGDTVYAAAYAGGNIVRFRVNEPWDQLHDVNPTTIARMACWGYIRPTGGIVRSPDGMLLSGWMAKYGMRGGAVAITNPVTGDTSVIENPLGELAIAGLETDGERLFIGSSVAANGLPDGDAPLRFGVCRLDTGMLMFVEEYAGAREVRVRGYDLLTCRVVITVDNTIRLFDCESRAFLPAEQLPPLTCYCVDMPGDGTMVYASEMSLYRYDLAGGAVQLIAESPSFVSNVAGMASGSLFFSCNADLYKVAV